MNQENNIIKVILCFIGIAFFFLIAPVINMFIMTLEPLLTPLINHLMPCEVKGPETILLVTIFTLISYSLWYIFGRDEKIIPIPTPYPPFNINSAEFETNLTGYSSQNGVLSLIFYMANKGYIEITDKGIDFSLRKIKPYEGKNPIEKEFLEGLFPDNEKDTVNLIELAQNHSFYMKYITLQNKLNNLNKNIYTKNSTTKAKIWVMLIASLVIGLSILYTLGDYTAHFILFKKDCHLFLIPFIIIIVSISAFSSIIQNKNAIIIKSDIETLQETANKNKGVYASCMLLTAMITISAIPLICLLNNEPAIFNHPYELLYEIICLISSLICLLNMKKLNPHGIALKQKVLGFKSFLENAQKTDIENVLFSHPAYFTDTLPYIYSLGLLSTCLNNMDINLNTPPVWYKGDFNAENLERLNNLINDL